MIPESENNHQVAAVGPKKNSNRKNKNNWKPQIPKDVCMWCGNSPRHDRSECPAKDDTCTHCNKPGHWARVCLSKTGLGSIGSANSADNIPHHQVSQSLQQLQLFGQQQQYQQQPYQPPFLQQNLETDFSQQQQQQQYHPISPNIQHTPQLA